MLVQPEKSGDDAIKLHAAWGMSVQMFNVMEDRRYRIFSYNIFLFSLMFFIINISSISQASANELPSCSIDGSGSGTCTFINSGWLPRSQCVSVQIERRQTDCLISETLQLKQFGGASIPIQNSRIDERCFQANLEYLRLVSAQESAGITQNTGRLISAPVCSGWMLPGAVVERSVLGFRIAPSRICHNWYSACSVFIVPE